MAAPSSLFKFLHCICVKSDLRITEIPSKKLKWIQTACCCLYSASNPPIKSTASTCSKTDGLSIFVSVWNRFSNAKIAYNISVNDTIFFFNTKLELT